MESSGLGISVNEKEVGKNPLQQEVIHSTSIRANGGAVQDC